MVAIVLAGAPEHSAGWAAGRVTVYSGGYMFGFLVLAASVCGGGDVRVVDELTALFPDRMPEAKQALGRLDVPRGAIVGLHLVVSGQDPRHPITVEVSGHGDLTAKLSRLLAVPVEENTGLESRTLQWDGRPNPHVVRAAPFEIFDPVQPLQWGNPITPSGSSGVTAIRIEFEVGAQVTPGQRDLVLKLDQGPGRGSLELRLPLVVHQASIPPIGRDSMRFTNWFAPNTLAARHDEAAWSELHWELLGQYADLMARTRQNVFEVPLSSFLSQDDDGVWVLARERLERYVEVFSSRGLYWMEGRHIASRPGGDWGAKRLEVRIGAAPRPLVGTQEASARVAAFFEPVREVFEDNGWNDRWLQHLADEPTDTNAASYAELATLVRRALPGVRLLEASMSTKLVGAVDVWCPQTRAFQQHLPFFRERMQAGDEVWVYSCLAPGGPWLNRLLDQERLRQVYLGWAASRDGVTGFLHWGYNRWRVDPYEQSVVDHPQRPGTKNKLPAGDTHVVYPLPSGDPGILSSLRLEAHRIGLEDRELLEALRAHDSELADTLTERVFRAYDDFETSPVAYRAARRALLEALSGD